MGSSEKITIDGKKAVKNENIETTFKLKSEENKIVKSTNDYLYNMFIKIDKNKYIYFLYDNGDIYPVTLKYDKDNRKILQSRVIDYSNKDIHLTYRNSFDNNCYTECNENNIFYMTQQSNFGVDLYKFEYKGDFIDSYGKYNFYTIKDRFDDNYIYPHCICTNNEQNKLYILLNNGIVIYDIISENKTTLNIDTVINNKPKTMFINNNDIYFIDCNLEEIYKINLNNKTITKIAETKSLFGFKSTDNLEAIKYFIEDRTIIHFSFFIENIETKEKIFYKCSYNINNEDKKITKLYLTENIPDAFLPLDENTFVFQYAKKGDGTVKSILAEKCYKIL